MKGKGAIHVFQKVHLREKDFAHIDDVVEHLGSQIDKTLNEVALKCEKSLQKKETTMVQYNY